MENFIELTIQSPYNGIEDTKMVINTSNILWVTKRSNNASEVMTKQEERLLCKESYDWVKEQVGALQENYITD